MRKSNRNCNQGVDAPKQSYCVPHGFIEETVINYIRTLCKKVVSEVIKEGKPGKNIFESGDNSDHLNDKRTNDSNFGCFHDNDVNSSNVSNSSFFQGNSKFPRTPRVGSHTRLPANYHIPPMYAKIYNPKYRNELSAAYEEGFKHGRDSVLTNILKTSKKSKAQENDYIPMFPKSEPRTSKKGVRTIGMMDRVQKIPVDAKQNDSKVRSQLNIRRKSAGMDIRVPNQPYNRSNSKLTGVVSTNQVSKKQSSKINTPKPTDNLKASCSMTYEGLSKNSRNRGAKKQPSNLYVSKNTHNLKPSRSMTNVGLTIKPKKKIKPAVARQSKIQKEGDLNTGSQNLLQPVNRSNSKLTGVVSTNQVSKKKSSKINTPKPTDILKASCSMTYEGLSKNSRNRGAKKQPSKLHVSKNNHNLKPSKSITNEGLTIKPKKKIKPAVARHSKIIQKEGNSNIGSQNLLPTRKNKKQTKVVSTEKLCPTLIRVTLKKTQKCMATQTSNNSYETL